MPLQEEVLGTQPNICCSSLVLVNFVKLKQTGVTQKEGLSAKELSLSDRHEGMVIDD